MRAVCFLVWLLHLIAIIRCEILSPSLKFTIKIINVNYTNAQFEIVDDNKTPTNYLIAYNLNSVYLYTNKNGVSITERDSSKNKFEIQTNSPAQRFNSTNKKSIEPIFWDNGKQLSSEEVMLLQSKTSVESHRFSIDTLDQNRVYDISFTIIASVTQTKVFNSSLEFTKQSVRTFMLQFRTPYNAVQAVESACNEIKNAEKTGLIEVIDYSCYQIATNCTKCAVGCYKANKYDSVLKDNRVLCERCPCDTSKSTGTCNVISEEGTLKFNSKLKFKCDKCIKPYTGDQCDKCEYEGIDFFRNKLGECQKCECNGNSVYDNADLNEGTHARKCKEVTGECLYCMFNTTGRHCHECKKGFHGDPLKRTCKSMTDSNAADAKSNNKIKQKSLPELLEHSYNSKSFLVLYFIFMIAAFFFFYGLISQYRARSDSFPKNNKYFKPIGRFIRFIGDCCVHLADFFYSLFSSNFKAHTSPPRNNNGNGRNVNINEDDRLNLAEYQIFDENALYEDNKNIENSDGEDPFQTNKNPYRTLTIKC